MVEHGKLKLDISVVGTFANNASAACFTEEITGQAMDTMKDKAQGAKDTTSDMAHFTRDRTQQNKDQTGNYLLEKTEGNMQQTKEQIKSMAKGATEVVKHIFGMDETEEDPHNKRDY